MEIRDPTPASLEECVDELAAWGFDPGEESSLSHAANWLKRLGNNPDFLGDALIAMLAGKGTVAVDTPLPQGAGTNHVMLTRPQRGHFILTADIWPSAGEHALRASAPRMLGYGYLHSHNVDFLTLGYFGPGYDVDDYICNPETLSGWEGERVLLRPLGRSRMKPGRLVHYRPGCDVHCLHPPEALSVTLSLSHAHGARSWMSHYAFEPVAGSAAGFRIARVLGEGPSEVFLRMAVALGGEEARDLAHRFGKRHPSDRMRLAAWQALATAAPDEDARDAIWREAEGSGSRAVAEVARRQKR
ncbi:MAG: transposase [Novosphingobium sp.]